MPPRNPQPLLVIPLVVLGCAAYDPGATTPLHAGWAIADRATFAVEAGPLLEQRCADTACHGRPERPFALYAAGARRLDPQHSLLKSALTAAELDANHAATLGFLDATQPRSTTLVKKAIGQLGHKGGAVFAAPSDPECAALLAWIQGKESP